MQNNWTAPGRQYEKEQRWSSALGIRWRFFLFFICFVSLGNPVLKCLPLGNILSITLFFHSSPSAALPVTHPKSSQITEADKHSSSPNLCQRGSAAAAMFVHPDQQRKKINTRGNHLSFITNGLNANPTLKLFFHLLVYSLTTSSYLFFWQLITKRSAHSGDECWQVFQYF